MSKVGHEDTPEEAGARPRIRWRRIALAVFSVYLMSAMALFSLQRSILFPRHFIPDPPNVAAQIPNLVRVDVTHADGISEGWLIPGRGVSAERPGPVVFHSHGNAELIDYAAPMLMTYLDWGVSIALVEYRGYGRSGGAPSQDAITEDLVAFYDLVTARPEIDATRVVLHGRSLGGGAMGQLAARRTARAMVLESTFRSVTAMARKMLLPAFLVRDPFDTEAVLRTIDVPLLLMHGTRDEVIPFENSEALLAAASNAKLLAFEAGHNDLPPVSKPYWAAIRAHFEAAGVLP